MSCYSDGASGGSARYVMQITVKEKSGLFVPPSVQRQAGIRSGDRLEFKVSPRTITITTVEPPTYKPTQAEMVAQIRQVGEGESPSDDASAVNRFVELVSDTVTPFAKVKTFPEFGRH